MIERREVLFSIASFPFLNFSHSTEPIESIVGIRAPKRVEYRYEDREERQGIETTFEWLRVGAEASSVSDKLFCLPRLDLRYYHIFPNGEATLHYRSEHGHTVSIYSNLDNEERFYIRHYNEDARNAQEFHSNSYIDIVNELAENDVIF